MQNVFYTNKYRLKNQIYFIYYYILYRSLDNIYILIYITNNAHGIPNDPLYIEVVMYPLAT